VINQDHVGKLITGLVKNGKKIKINKMKTSELRKLIKEIIQEENSVTHTTIGDLKFGKNIFDGDALPRTTVGMIKMHSEKDLESWKKNHDPSLEVIINRDPKTAWFDVVKVPAFEKSRGEESDAIMNLLSKEKRGTYFGD